MKIQLAGLLLTFSFYTEAQQLKIKENPVSIKYQLKHYELKGAVKKVTLKDATGKTIQQDAFDSIGRITKSLVGTGRYAIFYHFTYPPTSKAIYQKLEYATGEKVFIKYVYNNDGDIIQYYNGDKAGALFYLKNVYEYQDKLLKIDSAFKATASDMYNIYLYNKEGQVVNRKTYYQKSRILVAETTYEYLIQNKQPVMNIHLKADYTGKGELGNTTIIQKKYYDNKLNVVKDLVITKVNTTIDTSLITYNLDATGNWISNSDKETREIEYYAPAIMKSEAISKKRK